MTTILTTILITILIVVAVLFILSWIATIIFCTKSLREIEQEHREYTKRVNESMKDLEAKGLLPKSKKEDGGVSDIWSNAKGEGNGSDAHEAHAKTSTKNPET